MTIQLEADAPAMSIRFARGRVDIPDPLRVLIGLGGDHADDRAAIAAYGKAFDDAGCVAYVGEASGPVGDPFDTGLLNVTELTGVVRALTGWSESLGKPFAPTPNSQASMA